MEPNEQDVSQASSTNAKKKFFSNLVELPLFIFFATYYIAGLHLISLLSNHILIDVTNTIL